MRIPFAPRERACILHLRRKYKYSINQLANAFHRSASIIHQILKFNQRIGALKWIDNRALPGRVKKIAAARMQRQLSFYMPQWIMWILGEEERPP